ncbi:polyphosphate kinase 2 [Actinoplanes sp. NPDC026623]|uniref:polyphosphate kinase 2 n=1 Tax=Actinoplanes sp. NPDC026623 TaxID=3155610 RepID=UPI00340717F6
MTGAGSPRLATDDPAGDVVNGSAARGVWPLGPVQRVPPDSDALVLLDDRLTPVSEVVDAYHAAVEELQELKRDRKRVSRKLRAETELRPWQVELLKLQRHLEKHRMRMIVLFEGRDAAGKGGTIRRVTRYMNEKHYRVVALGRPSEDQRSQWYFQRYAAQLPAGGEIVLFDRSWYNRAMVEPVCGFCTQDEYQHFMWGVTGFEKDLVRQGTILVKLYFSVTKEEQRRRFARRHTDPLRQWKFSEIDSQAQDRWDDYTKRKYEMIRRTGTVSAPWVIIRSGDKQRARLNAMKVMLNAVDYEDRSTELDFEPDRGVVLSGAQEIALMEAERARSGSFTS